MKAALLLTALSMIGTSPLDASVRVEAASPLVTMKTASRNPAMVLAGKLDWLDDFLRGTRGTERLGRPAYHYTRSEDRRGKSKGILYFLMTAIWRIAVGGTSAAIANSAARKRFKSTNVQGWLTLSPFVISLFAPLLGLGMAGIIWVALAGSSKDATEGEAQDAPITPPSDQT